MPERQRTGPSRAIRGPQVCRTEPGRTERALQACRTEPRVRRFRPNLRFGKKGSTCARLNQGRAKPHMWPPLPNLAMHEGRRTDAGRTVGVALGHRAEPNYTFGKKNPPPPATATAEPKGAIILALAAEHGQLGRGAEPNLRRTRLGLGARRTELEVRQKR